MNTLSAENGRKRSRADNVRRRVYLARKKKKNFYLSSEKKKKHNGTKTHCVYSHRPNPGACAPSIFGVRIARKHNRISDYGPINNNNNNNNDGNNSNVNVIRRPTPQQQQHDSDNRTDRAGVNLLC